MRDLLELIVKNIATQPDDVVIDETTDDTLVTYSITVGPADMGRIIGKSGKVIKSIRNIAHVAAIRQGKRFRINVAEVDGRPSDVEINSTESDEAEKVVFETPANQDAPMAVVNNDIITEALDTDLEE